MKEKRHSGLMTVAAVLLKAVCAAAVLTTLAGCTADRPDEVRGLVPITLTAKVENNTRTEAVTRAGADVQSTQLAEGSTFVAEFTGSDVTVSSTVYQAANDGSITIAEGSAQPSFTFSGSSTTVHAYHPSKPSETFSVAADQSEDAGYKASDLMYATVAVTKENPSGNLSFTHKMAKIVVNATAGAGVGNITGVYLIGGYRTIALSDVTSCILSTDAADLSDANSADGTNITMFSGSASSVSCAALIPPQTVDGTFIKVTTASDEYTYDLDAKTLASGGCYTFNISFSGSSPAEAVDLGLSVKWANMNVGATSETDYGTYFAWGETSGYTDESNYSQYYFAWATYKWCQSSNTTLTKYCPSSLRSTYWWDKTSEASTAPDNRMILELTDDAAHANWGGNWRTPTKAELEELLNTYNTGDDTNWKWTWYADYNDSGHAGFLITYKGVTPNTSIFVPAAGYRYDATTGYLNSAGFYLASTLRTNEPDFSDYLYLSSGERGVLRNSRSGGCTVRPVYDENVTAPTYTVNPSTLNLGDIIYDDGSVTANDAYNPSKHAVGVVVYKAANPEAACEAGVVSSYGTVAGRALVMAIQDVKEISGTKKWFTSNGTDHNNTLFPNCNANLTTASGDFQGYAKTKQLATHTGECASHTHDAAEAAWSYSPLNATKTAYLTNSTGWFLPSIGQWIKVFYAMAAASNTTATTLQYKDWNGDSKPATLLMNYLITAGGTASAIVGGDNIWTSSEHGSTYVHTVYWRNDLSNRGMGWSECSRNLEYFVRPFLAY